MYKKILTHARYHSIYDKAKKLLIMLILLFAYGTIGFSVIKQVDLQTGFVLTIESLEFAHKAETTFLARAMQTSLLIFGSVLLWFTLWTIFELIFKGHLRKYLIEVMHLVKAGRSKDHIIVCGGGRVGHFLATLLKAKNKQIVIIEKDHATAIKLRHEKFTVINGDALNEDTLKEANIEKASILVAAISSGEKNILLTLTARQLNPNIEVLARSDDENHVKKLKNVGVRSVIMPEIAGAKELFSLIK